MAQERKLHLEVLRCIAAFFVIFNHTDGFSVFTQYSPQTLPYWLLLFLSVACKVSVPLFFMISGALLLHKEHSARDILRKILRIAGTLLAFSFLSYLQQVYKGNETFHLGTFFRVLLTSDWMNVYWYLYAYLAFLATLPFMQAMAKGMRSSHFVYLIVLQIVVTGVIPVALYLLWQGKYGYNSNFSFAWLLGNYPLYPLVGYFLEHRLDTQKISGRKLALLWAANILCIGITGYVSHRNIVLAGSFTQHYIMVFTIVHCLTLYITAKKYAAMVTSAWLKKAVISVGGCTFGIYLLHGLLLREPATSPMLVLQWIGLVDSVNPLMAPMIRTVEVMVLGYLLTRLLKKIPGVNQWI